MQISQNYPLKHLNTFCISANAAFFVAIRTENDINDFLLSTSLKNIPLLILGGGSNVLFTKDFDGCVVHMDTKGISVTAEDDDYVILEAAAGEKWENLIEFCVEHNYGGLENLSGIPGNVGSSPIQNIGAYGAEVKNCIFEVHTIDLTDGSRKEYVADECRFGYRDSIFKHELKGKVLIEKVVFYLSKKPEFNLCYKGVEEEVKRISPDNVNIKAISAAIQNIRKAKIPDTQTVGSAGSFFKNPFVNNKEMDVLLSSFPDISYNKTDENCYKLAAAWMIEQCGWKGYRKGDASVNENQPLILVNYGKASGSEILELSVQIRESVAEKFGIELEEEVNIV
jgi:UDP-N-acetylmuramate dehydrogenase